jgi:hypothetical protein
VHSAFIQPDDESEEDTFMTPGAPMQSAKTTE